MISNTTAVKDDVNKMKSAGQDLHNDLQSTARNAGSKIRNLYDSASDEIHHATDVVSSEIRTNPVRASVIALGVGVLLGALIRR